MNNQLEIIVKESGLEQTKAAYILKQFQDYFKIASEWETKAKQIVVTDENQVVDMKLARTGRLFLREKRITLENSRKELKEQSLREGKAIDGIANVLKALIVPIEDYLDRQEHFVENKKQAEDEIKRLEEIKRVEEERIAKEQAEALERERIQKENEILRAEAIKREKEQAEERAKAEAERKAIEEKNRIEREKEAKERARVEAELKTKAEAERKALEAQRLAEDELKKMIECPFCNKKFKLER
jgi:hypothetical protein